MPEKRQTPKPNHMYRAGASKLVAHVAQMMQQKMFVPNVNLYCIWLDRSGTLGRA